MTMTKAQQSDQQGAIDRLREMIQPGDTVYTILRHVSRSGMQREISVLVGDGKDVTDLDFYVARALGDKIGAHNGIKRYGCGMDMGFDLVYSLSRTLFSDYTCLGERCPAAIHVNQHTPRDGHTMHHNDGYALNHRWL